MRPYHPNNLELISHPAWRVIVLAWVGKLLGIQLHIEGIPFGGPYRGPEAESDTSMDAGNMETGNV